MYVEFCRIKTKQPSVHFVQENFVFQIHITYQTFYPHGILCSWTAIQKNCKFKVTEIVVSFVFIKEQMR